MVNVVYNVRRGLVTSPIWNCGVTCFILSAGWIGLVSENTFTCAGGYLFLPGGVEVFIGTVCVQLLTACLGLSSVRDTIRCK